MFRSRRRNTASESYLHTVHYVWSYKETLKVSSTNISALLFTFRLLFPVGQQQYHLHWLLIYLKLLPKNMAQIFWAWQHLWDNKTPRYVRALLLTVGSLLKQIRVCKGWANEDEQSLTDPPHSSCLLQVKSDSHGCIHIQAVYLCEPLC